MANERASGVSFSRPITALLNVNKVTGGERAVLGQLLDGRSNIEIANNLFLSDKTVKFHITNLYKKLNVRDRVQLVIKIAKLGYYAEVRQDTEELPTGAIN